MRGAACGGCLGVGLLLAVLAGCGAARAPATTRAEVHVAPRATLDRAIDPVDAAPNEDVARPVVMTAGVEEARALLFALLEAIRAEDVEGLRALLVEEPLSIQVLRDARRPQRLLAPMRRDQAIARLVVPARVAGSAWRSDARPLVDPERVAVLSARQFFEGAPPEGVEPSDLVVLFDVPDSAGPLLRSVAIRDRGMILVRVSAERARILGI